MSDLLSKIGRVFRTRDSPPGVDPLHGRVSGVPRAPLPYGTPKQASSHRTPRAIAQWVRIRLALSRAPKRQPHGNRRPGAGNGAAPQAGL